MDDTTLYEICIAYNNASRDFTGAMKAIGPMYSSKGVYDLRETEATIAEARPVFVDNGESVDFAVKDILYNNSVSPADKRSIVGL